MIVIPLCDPKTATYNNIIKWARSLRLPIKYTSDCIKAIIVLGDGTPDEIVIMILAHLLDGKVDAGIVKPKYLRVGAIRAIKNIALSFHGKISDFVLLMDLEDQTQEQILESLNNKLAEYGIGYQVIERQDMWWKYHCEIANIRFTLTVIINGLEQEYEKHTIEDHLLELAQHLKICVSNVQRLKNPKQAWNKIPHKQRKQIFEELKRLPIEVRKKIFRQHIEALESIIRTLS